MLQKSLHSWIQIFTTCGAWLLWLWLTSAAAHAASVPGDYVVVRNAVSTTSITTATYTADWDTVVATKGGSVSTAGATTTVDAGKYLVLYGDRFDTEDITNNQRVEIQSRIAINGVATTSGAGQTYIRKEDSTAGDWQRAAIVSGSAILDIPSDNTDVTVQYYRTDTASDAGGTTDRTASWGGATILALDDGWNYARYQMDSATGTVDAFNDVEWDSTLEEDAGFSRIGSDITIDNAGRYLVTYSIPVQSSSASNRTEYISRISLDDVAVTGTFVSTYIRGNQGTQDGVLSYVGVVDVVGGSVLNIEMDMTDGTLSEGTILSGASLQLAQLPAENESIIVKATDGEMNPATLTEFAWDTTTHIDTDAFTDVSATDSVVEIDIADDYLFFATQQTDNGNTRTFPSARFSVNDVISSTTAAGQYNRGSGADDAGYSFGGLLTGLSPGDEVSLENVFIEVDHAAQTNNQAAMAGLRLGSIFPPPTEWNSTSWTLYDTITIDHNNIDESLGDFPVYVDLSDLSPIFWSTVSSDGGDIRVTTDSDTPIELAREVVSASTTLETGELHFKADFINRDADTSFRIYYNGVDAEYQTGQTYGAENVWSNGYELVMHLNEQANNDPGGYFDSTQYQNHGTGTSITTGGMPVAGQLGASQDFVLSDPDSIVIPGELGSPFSNYTLSAWVSADAVDTAGSHIVSIGNHTQLELSLGGDPEAAYFAGTFDTLVDLGNDVRGNGFYYQTFVFDDDNNNQSLYIDGVSTDSSSDTDSVDWIGRGDSVTIGTHGDTQSNLDFDGRIDEVRIASTTRSAAWIRAEYLNQSTTTDFYRLSSGTGSSTISDHDAGQVSDAFNFQNKIEETLFAFKLTPETDVATVTSLTIDLSGARNVSVGDFSEIRLVRDNNSDVQFNSEGQSADTLLGSGTMTANGQFGTIVFEDAFQVSPADPRINYLVIADFNAPARGSQLNFDLYPSGVRMIDADGGVVVTGSVDRVQHERAESRGGGGGSSSAVGDPAPAGDGDVSGGTNDGGELIGDEADFYWPGSHNDSFWSFPELAYDQVNATYANVSINDFEQDYADFAQTVPVGDEVSGIEVVIEVFASADNGTAVDIQLSWDGGATFTTVKSTEPITTTEALYTLGGASDLWGRSWTPGELSDANFELRMILDSSGSTFVFVDSIQVKVHHQAGGGGSGGGGAI